jgi:hypothetical protein
MPLTTVSQGLLSTDAQYTGFKNRLINGGMTIDQRNNGASVTPTTLYSQYTLDRWTFNGSQASKASVQQDAGGVTPPAGFTDYLGITSLSAYSVGASDFFALNQYVEGFNTADLGFGASGASAVTLSFWVRSSLTGTFGGNLSNSANNRNYVFSYTISSANTWEQKSVTIPGDTTGTWLKTNGAGFQLGLCIGSGSNFTDTAGAWYGSAKYAPTGQTSVVGTNGATFYVTGVQLEKGSTATSFDYRPYGTELNLCYRYCYRQARSTSDEIGIGVRQGGEYIKWPVVIPVTMRAAPTWLNPPTSYVTTNLSASGQITSYNFSAAALYTISGSLSTINQLNVNGGGLYIVASGSFSGSAGAVSGVAMFDSPLFSAEL